MSLPAADSGSFRDPAGRVYIKGENVYRTVNPPAVADFDFVEGTGLLDRLAARGLVVASRRVPNDILPGEADGATYVLQHPRLPFVSYPYEWPFAALKAAALLHLDIHLEALSTGVTLSDASAYNVQFIGTKPVFIDRLSFVRYRPGAVWVGHRQFCEQFLNPLLLRALLGIAHNAWYRGTQEGIPADDLRRLLGWRHKLSRNVLMHVVLPSVFQAGARADEPALDRRAIEHAMPLETFQRLLRRLRDWIAELRPAGADRTVWRDYADDNGYAAEEADAKRRFLADFAGLVRPRMLWDIGCNTGIYARTALEAGAGYAVGFDFDQGALDRGFTATGREDLKLQFLFLDASNPSPDQGWGEEERQGMRTRGTADGLLALALIHHLAIAKNVPLERVLSWLTDLAPAGIIEFIPKADPMVQRLLRWRDDIFPDYNETAFLRSIGRRARIVRQQRISSSGRLLVWYDRGQDRRG